MRWNLSFTLEEWWPHWFVLDTYLAVGIGPIYLEFDWGTESPQWEL